MKKVFTTGQVAKICKVAPRTVSKWFDSGRLQGYKIPGSNDRRIPRDSLIRFLQEHGMPLGELADFAEEVPWDEEKPEAREPVQAAAPSAPVRTPTEQPPMQVAVAEPWEP